MNKNICFWFSKASSKHYVYYNGINYNTKKVLKTFFSFSNLTGTKHDFEHYLNKHNILYIIDLDYKCMQIFISQLSKCFLHFVATFWHMSSILPLHNIMVCTCRDNNLTIIVCVSLSRTHIKKLCRKCLLHLH